MILNSEIMVSVYESLKTNSAISFSLC